MWGMSSSAQGGSVGWYKEFALREERLSREAWASTALAACDGSSAGRSGCRTSAAAPVTLPLPGARHPHAPRRRIRIQAPRGGGACPAAAGQPPAARESRTPGALQRRKRCQAALNTTVAPDCHDRFFLGFLSPVTSHTPQMDRAAVALDSRPALRAALALYLLLLHFAPLLI